MLADAFQVGAYCFFVCKGLVFVIVHVVGNLAGFRHFTYLHFDGCYAVGDFTYQFLAVSAEYFILFRSESLAQSTQVFQQTVLVDNGSRYDMVDGKIT